jgi:hypothetical protein
VGNTRARRYRDRDEGDEQAEAIVKRRCAPPGADPEPRQHSHRTSLAADPATALLSILAPWRARSG